MTGIDGYDWSVFGGNPVPGDPDVARAVSGQLRDVADEATSQNRLLQSVSSDSETIWSGPAADAFKPTIGKLPGQLDQLVTSYYDAADSLDAYWPALRDAQQLAVEALSRATSAQQAITDAKSAVSSASSTASQAGSSYNQASTAAVNPTSTQTAHIQALQSSYRTAQSNLSSANTALSTANGQMAAAQALKDQAVGQYQTAGARAASGLKAASDAGIHNPHHSWLSSALGDIGHMFTSAFKQGEQFTEGVFDGLKGPVEMIAKLADPLTAPQELEQLAKGLAYGVSHPLAFGKALLDWKDLSDGNISRWLGNLAPAVAAAVFTGGAGDVADGLDGLTAVDRAGMSADDLAGVVASGNQDAAARILMRGDDPVPGSIYSDGTTDATRGEVGSQYGPETQYERQRANFDGEPVQSDPEPGTWAANVHDSSDPLAGDDAPGRSLQWSVRPTDILSMTGTEDYENRLALLPEWAPGGVRDEMTVIRTSAGDGPMWEGPAQSQTSKLVGGPTLDGGGNQILINHLSGASGVWTGPLPWTKVPDPTLVLKGIGKLAGAAGTIDGSRVLSGTPGQ